LSLSLTMQLPSLRAQIMHGQFFRTSSSAISVTMMKLSTRDSCLLPLRRAQFFLGILCIMVNFYLSH
jgi:hypothetical protein